MELARPGAQGLTPNPPFPTLSRIASEEGGMADEWEEIRRIEERVAKRRTP